MSLNSKTKKIYLVFIFLLFFAHVVLCAEKNTYVTNSFFETDIREVLRDISAQTGVKIVPDETVQGTISIELKDVPLEEALRMVLAIGNYTFRKMDEGYYLVGLCTPNSPSFSRLSVTEYFHPNYLSVKELQGLISEFYQPFIRINEDGNTMTVTASPEIVARLKEDLKRFDLPKNQVMIEALVVELTEEGRKSLGITWGSMLEGGFSIYPPSDIQYDKIAGKGQYQLAGTLSQDLLMRINTLISDGTAKVRANPRIATLEGKQAEIFVGREEYFLINVGGTAQAYYTLQSVATGVVLKITPIVDNNDQITVTISPQVSEVVGKGSMNLPVVTRRTASTSVRVNDGQTIAIGGLLQEQSVDSFSRVPILGSMPLVGKFFSSKSYSTKNTEVVIFITPRLMSPSNFSIAKNNISGNIDTLQQAVINGKKPDPVDRYRSNISNIINGSKRLPDMLKRVLPKEVTVEFTVFFNGEVDKINIVKSSGLRQIDQSTVDLIQKLSPFPAFPEDLEIPSLTITLPVRYES